MTNDSQMVGNHQQSIKQNLLFTVRGKDKSFFKIVSYENMDQVLRLWQTSKVGFSLTKKTSRKLFGNHRGFFLR